MLCNVKPAVLRAAFTRVMDHSSPLVGVASGVGASLLALALGGTALPCMVRLPLLFGLVSQHHRELLLIPLDVTLSWHRQLLLIGV